MARVNDGLEVRKRELEWRAELMPSIGGDGTDTDGESPYLSTESGRETTPWPKRENVEVSLENRVTQIKRDQHKK